MKKVTLELSGEAEKLFEELKLLGMSNASIIGKAFYCLKMVKHGDYINKEHLANLREQDSSDVDVQGIEELLNEAKNASKGEQ